MEFMGYYISLNLILCGVLAFFVLIFIITLIALINSLKANKKMKIFLRENRGTNITQIVTDYYNKCEKIEIKSEKLLIEVRVNSKSLEIISNQEENKFAFEMF